jgi:hypothetical protein
MRLLRYLGRIKLLISGLEPVEQGLSSWESKRANDHPQAAAAHDFLQFLSDRFYGDGIVAAVQSPRIFHILLTIAAISSKADVISEDTRCLL